MALSSPPTPELKGTLGSLFRFFLPIFLMSLIGTLTPFFEKLLFGTLSSEALTASVDVNMIARIFQLVFISAASLSQVYVGRWYGSREYHQIGPGVWQLMWFSLLSCLITLPLGFWIGELYFKEEEIALLARPYLYTYLGMNFLFPLRATLTGFYLGLGKASSVTGWTIASEALQLIISFFLIKGIQGWVPSLGLMGGAISHLAIQTMLCLFLFMHFFKTDADQVYKTRYWKWQPRLFWDLIKPGFFRAASHILQAPSWAAIAYLMTQMGNPYDLVLSTGITLFYFLACIGNSIQTTIMTYHAQLIGAKAYHLLYPSIKSCYQLIGVVFVILGVPMLFFSGPMYRLLFPHLFLESALMNLLPKVIWMTLLTGAIGNTLNGVLLAFKDTRFLFLAGAWSVIYDLGLCTVLGIFVFKISSSYFWPMISAGHILLTFTFSRRIQRCRKALLESQQQNF